MKKYIPLIKNYSTYFIFLFSIFVIFSCSKPIKEKLIEDGKEGNVDELVEIMRVKLISGDKELFSFAADQVLSNNLSKGYDYLEKVYFGDISYNLSPNDNSELIFSSYYKNKKCFKDLPKLINKVLTDKSDNTSLQYLGTYLDNYGNKEAIQSLNKIRNNYLALGQYPMIKKSLYVQKFSKFPLCSTDIQLDSILNSATFENGEIYLYPEVLDIQNQINTIKTNLSSIDNADSEISDLYSDIEELEKDRENYDYFWLNGYIIQFAGNIEQMEKYEIRRSGSRIHSYLVTKQTSFETTGSFSMRVRFVTTAPIKIKEEFGGFTQNWDMYVEATDSDIRKYDEITSSIKRKKNEIRELESLKNSKKINELNHKLVTLEERLSNINEAEKSIVSSLLTESRNYYFQKYQ